MDGVILDSEPLHENARQMMFQRFGIVPDAAFPDPVGNSSSGFWREVIKKCGIEGEPYDLEREQYRLVAQQIEENRISPSEGLEELLCWAKTHEIGIGLASSSTRVLVDDTLRLLGIEKYFDYTVSGDEVPVKKPAPDVYQRVLEMAGSKPGTRRRWKIPTQECRRRRARGSIVTGIEICPPENRIWKRPIKLSKN